ncbi:MAG TPA: serine protease, partial [Myxococcaceae bacterium]|nr:serine protease [Myxococcaceae bacterium]
LLAWAAMSLPAGAVEPGTSLKAKPYCAGEYADDFTALASQVREFENQPQSRPSSYCIRNTATYECLSYSPDGGVRRIRRKAVLHGTAFGYRIVGGETLLLTNQHIAEWPAVTDEDHPVDDVAVGCKRVADSLRIVENEADAYERDDIPLTRVVTDVQLDVAVVKARVQLPILPWKVGRSAALRERNVVDVRGFPLGAFRATNVGKVVSAYDHDDEKDWDHDDFVIDALLSPGNSGSPVLAVSCRTGEYELVGLYHAGYTGGSALNVVVGIDQVRDLMTTLKRSPRGRAEAAQGPDARDRTRLTQDARFFIEPFFPLGSLPASVRARGDGALVFEVLSRDFPLKSHPLLVIEDLPPQRTEAFGELGRLWFGGPQGLKPYARSELEGDAQGQVTRVLDVLRRNALSTFAYRAAARGAQSSRERFEQVAKLERGLKRTASGQRDVVQLVVELADRFGPHGADVPVHLSDALAIPISNPAFPGPAEASTAPPPRSSADSPRQNSAPSEAPSSTSVPPSGTEE